MATCPSKAHACQNWAPRPMDGSQYWGFFQMAPNRQITNFVHKYGRKFGNFFKETQSIGTRVTGPSAQGPSMSKIGPQATGYKSTFSKRHIDTHSHLRSLIQTQVWQLLRGDAIGRNQGPGAQGPRMSKIGPQATGCKHTCSKRHLHTNNQLCSLMRTQVLATFQGGANDWDQGDRAQARKGPRFIFSTYIGGRYNGSAA